MTGKVIALENYIGKLSTDLTSEEYHQLKGTFSSSQLKDMLKDPEYFYRKYISKEEERAEIGAFHVGTYFHTAVLEPEKLQDECAVYTGKIRNGKDWEDFKAANAGKCIITQREVETVEKLVKAVRNSPVSMGCLSGAAPEVSAFCELYVLGDDIFSSRNAYWYCLDVSCGWMKTTLDYEPEDIAEFGVKVIVKVRADAIKLGEGMISDLKSTTGNAKSTWEMQQKVSSYNYDLSAAFYLDIFSIVTGSDYEKFVWIFASKDYHNCKSYVASARNIQVGRAKWRRAVADIAKYKSANWKFVDEMGEIGPTVFNLEWIK